MNWIERLHELKGRDLYSQNGEGFYLEYILRMVGAKHGRSYDIGGGDGFYLSNTRHLCNLDNDWDGIIIDKEQGDNVTLENIDELTELPADIVSIDIDGNDFWILDAILKIHKPSIVIAEFNAMYTDSRAIRYNPNHEWEGDSYYGFTFKAGEKLAELHGYKVIFQIADMNMIMVREDLVADFKIPPVTYKQNDYFKLSDREDWIKI